MNHIEGGKKTANTNKKLYGEDFYVLNGIKGGKASAKSKKHYKLTSEKARQAALKRWNKNK